MWTLWLSVTSLLNFLDSTSETPHDIIRRTQFCVSRKGQLTLSNKVFFL